MALNSSLHIKAGYKNGKTFLKESYFTHPFKVANITEVKTEEKLRLMIMSSSPGVLDNDNYTIDIEIEENAILWLTTQAYQRIFKMQNGASQLVDIKLGDKASCFYLPHPTVPHEDADFTSLNTVRLQKDHRFVWSEIITCGRKHSGEAFRFKRYKNTTKIFIENRLSVFENVLLLPTVHTIHSLGQLEGYSHQSSLIFLDNKRDMKLIAEETHALLSLETNISFGISALSVNGIVIRMLGCKGEQLFKLHNQIAQLITALSGPRLTKTAFA